MTNRKTTRRALVLSLLSLLVCCSMLVGTTFAWFTDSVTSGNNKIVAGNLDIELEYSKDMSEGSWKTVSNATDLFSDTLWEPGHTQVVYLKLSNLGTLALKYNFSMNFTDTVVGTSVEGNEIKLSEHLKYDIVDVTAKYADRDAAREAVEDTAETLAAYSVNGEMLRGADPKVMALVIYMPETVGNEANYRGTNVPQIDLGLNLFATQVEAETDSFGKDYDKNAGWLGGADTSWYNETDSEFVITTAEQLAGLAVLVNGGNTFDGKTVKLGSDINLAGSNWTPMGTFKGTLDGQSNTISGMTVEADKYAGLFGYMKDSGATITNLIIDGAEVTAITQNTDGYAGALIGYHDSTAEKVTVSNVAVTNSVITGKNGGAVIGAVSGGYVSGCTSTGNTIIASRNGGVIGKTLEFGSVTDNTVSNNTQTVKIFSDESYVWVGTVVGQVVRGTVEGNETQRTDLINSVDDMQKAINASNELIIMAAGTYKMPSISGDKEFTISGTKDTVIDITVGAYMDSATVSFEGVTIKGSTGYVYDANGNKGSDYAALYSPNVTYTNCTFDGPFRIGRDGATFINCTFTNLGNDYVWTYGNDCTFENCTFESEGKALLIYSDGGSEVSKVTVKNCTFNATKGGTAWAIANQNCAAIEIQNYGNGVDLTVSGCTVNSVSDTLFSGLWRIKAYHANQPAVIINGVTYTSVALDGKLMNVDADRNATFQ